MSVTNHVYCPHGYVLPEADHPAAGLENCPHGCTDEPLLFHDEEQWDAEEARQREVFGF